MSVTPPLPKLNIPVVAASGAFVPTALPTTTVPVIATPTVAPVVIATGPKSMLNTAKSWLGLGGRRGRSRGRKAAATRRRRGRKGGSRRRRASSARRARRASL